MMLLPGWALKSTMTSGRSAGPTRIEPVSVTGLKGTLVGILAGPARIPTNVPFNPVTLTGSILVGPAERPDVIVDFSAHPGKSIILYNDAPAPFPIGVPVNDYFPG